MNKLDELLADFEWASKNDAHTMVLTRPDFNYVVSILRAAQKLRRGAAAALCNLDDLGQYGVSAYYDLESACDEYDNTINGTEKSIQEDSDDE